MVWKESQHAGLPIEFVGPFEQWPTGMGFEYFYGFMGGDTNQWTANLARNTTPMYPLSAIPNTTSSPTWRTTPSRR